MKTLLRFTLAFALVLGWTGCDSDDADNGAPTAATDQVTVGEDEAVVIDVLDNDTDPEGDALTVTAVAQPANGTAAVTDDGETVTYTPDAGYSGSDTFTYTVTDADGNTATGTVTVEVIQLLVGTWVSEGDDVAPGLAGNPAFPVESIDATFNADGSYTVVATNTDGVAVTFTGNYETSASANGRIRTIVLEQSTPSQVTSTGIYEVSEDRSELTYEVIQTEPALQGFTAPTAAAGFGSTAFNGTALGAVWIQNFVRVQAAS